MKNEKPIVGPIQDYVHRVKPLPRKVDRLNVACKVFVTPMFAALLLAVFTDGSGLWARLATGFLLGFCMQSLLVYSFYAIKALITGEDNGI